MRNIFRTQATAAIITLVPSTLFAQAFGIEIATPVNELDVLSDLGNFYYSVNPPRTVSSFKTYIVYATPEAGVCVVKGIGENFERDGYGINVRSRFEELKELLDKNYGNGQIHDGLRPGALYDEIDDWVMALLQNERYYQAEWKVDDPDGIDGIIISVEALSPSASYIALQYRFANIEDCRDEAKAKDAGGL